jgi:hypothetical protein
VSVRQICPLDSWIDLFMYLGLVSGSGGGDASVRAAADVELLLSRAPGLQRIVALAETVAGDYMLSAGRHAPRTAREDDDRGSAEVTEPPGD